MRSYSRKGLAMSVLPNESVCNRGFQVVSFILASEVSTSWKHTWLTVSPAPGWMCICLKAALMWCYRIFKCFPLQSDHILILHMHNKIRTSPAVKQWVATNDALVRIVESKCDSCGQLTHTVLMSQGVKIRVELMAEGTLLDALLNGVAYNQ